LQIGLSEGVFEFVNEEETENIRFC
jgi:hypothetical protein